MEKWQRIFLTFLVVFGMLIFIFPILGPQYSFTKPQPPKMLQCCIIASKICLVMEALAMKTCKILYTTITICR